MQHRPEHVTEVVDALLRYLDTHPDASDTLDGIARWWLPPTLHAEADLVRMALDRLMAQGIMRQHTNADHHVLYSGRDGCAQGSRAR